MPRSLMISPILPSPGGNGLAMRMCLFAEALARFSETHVLVIPVAGGLPEGVPPSEAFRLHRMQAGGGWLETAFILLSSLPDPAGRLDAFIEWGRPSQSAGLSRPVLNAVAELVRDLSPDLIHIGRVALAPCIGVLPEGPKVTLDLDEDDRAAFAMRTPGDRYAAAWLRQEGLACDRLVAEHGPGMALIHVSSAGERASLARRHPDLSFKVVPNAVPCSDARPPGPGSRRRTTAVFVGSLSYPPNVEGLIWFIRRVMPLLDVPDFRLEIVGAGAPPDLIAAARRGDVRLRGWVADLDEVYRRATLAILPLHSGGGTRIKLIEAAAHGTPFVATRRAAAGLAFPSASGWFADSPKGFADRIRELLASPAEARRRSAMARRFVRSRHDRARVIAALAQDLRSVL